jgi:hypothetical protein
MLFTSYGTGKAAARGLARAIRSGRIGIDDARDSVERVLDVRHYLP